jgi:hypothetical protein
VNIRNWALAAALVLLAACSRGADDQPISYDGKVVQAHGWKGSKPASWDKVLEVYANASPGSPPMLGDYEKHGSTIEFKPRFKPSPAVSLYVIYHRPDGTIASSLFPAKAGYKAASIAKVVQVYPTANAWPANILKLYIQFSGPMKQGGAYDHIHLLDEAGQPIKLPFVQVDQELWDPAGTRLTVLFDPGRIKRGLVDNATEGPPLVPGHKYTLKIDKDWLDTAGAPLTDGFEKAITASPDVREPVTPSAWKVTAPASNQALVINFPRPMDNALAKTAITVTKDGAKIPGRIILDTQETHWVFVPDHAWAPGAYQIHVEGTTSGISDVAGNLLGRLFDMDKSDSNQKAAGDGPASADIPFKVS